MRRRIAEGEPTATAIANLAILQAAATPDTLFDPTKSGADPSAIGAYVTANAIAHILTGEQRYADQAHLAITAWTAPRALGELTRANWALHAAIAHDCCYPAWSPTQRAQQNALLARLAESFRTIYVSAGDPHDMTNNHWAVAHAGAAIAAMAAHGLPSAGDQQHHLDEIIDWARGRMRPFLGHHGDQGLYHEGLGYLAYPASYWLPMIVASRNFDGLDFAETFPNLHNLAAALYASACARPGQPEDGNLPPTTFGRKVSWNDDGQGWIDNNTAILSIHLAHPEQISALRWLYDRLSGIHANRTFAPQGGGWFFSLLFYPYDIPPHDPNGILPNHITDYRQGLTLIRNRYRDGDDAILGCYARTTFVGGHKHDDAGSIRMMALGHDWIMGGGQARPEAHYQSVFTPAQGRTKPYQLGRVIWDEVVQHKAPLPDDRKVVCGGVFAMDLRKASGCYAERYVAVDYTGACGAPVLLAILDQIDDHLGRNWAWNLTFEPGLTLDVHAGNRGFSLIATDGSSFVAHFLGEAPKAITLARAPDARRRFQSGAIRSYPGRPYLRATFPARERRSIYVVATVQREAPPDVKRVFGLTVYVGQHQWRRPFGASVPATFRPGFSGTLCRFPDGIVWQEESGKKT